MIGGHPPLHRPWTANSTVGRRLVMVNLMYPASCCLGLICFFMLSDYLECRTHELDEKVLQLFWTANFFERHQNNFYHLSMLWDYLQL